MRHEIFINKEELLHRVELLTHYHSEADKRNDLNADVGEVSPDDAELMETFIRKAIYELIAPQAARLGEITFNTTGDGICISFTGGDNGSQISAVPILKQAIEEFLVNELMTQWLMVRRRSWSDTYIAMRNELYDKVQRLFDRLSNRKIRRRSTGLAGI